MTLGAATAAVTVADDDDVPAAPSDFTAAAVSATEVELSWTPSAYPGQLDGAAETVSRYEYDVDGADHWQNAGAGPPFTVSGLAAETTYSFRLRAVNAVGHSDAAGPAAATTHAAAELAITISIADAPTVTEGETVRFTVTFSAVRDANVFLYWQAAGPGYSPSGAADIPPGALSTTIEVPTKQDALDNGDQTLTVTISLGEDAPDDLAVDVADATVVIKDDDDPPSPPTDFTAAAVSDTEVELSWTASADPGQLDGVVETPRYEYHMNGAGDWRDAGLASPFTVLGLTVDTALPKN